MARAAMGERPARPLFRAASWLALAYVLAFFGLALAAITEGDWAGIVLGFPAILWMASPVIVAAGFVGASSTRIGATVFLLLEVGLILSFFGLLIAYRGEGAIIGLPFLPVIQFGAIILVFLAALPFGWRMRPDFLKD